MISTVLLASALMTLGMSNPASSPSHLGAGLVAYYPFDGNADDASGNLRHGTVHGAVLVPDRFGTPSSAYAFDGVDDFVKAAANGLPTAERTVALWFRADVLGQPGLIGYGGGSSCGTSWLMSIDGVRRYYARSTHCSVNDLLYNFPRPDPWLPVGRWIHWAVTTSPSGSAMYVNGRLVASNLTTVSNTQVAGADLSIGVLPGPDGLAPYADSNVGYFRGAIDDVRIYDRALSAAEILKLSGLHPAVSPMPRPPLVVLFPWLVLL